MQIPLRPTPREDTSAFAVSINRPSNRNWQTKVLDSWKVTQLNLLRQKSVKSVTGGGGGGGGIARW